MTVRNEFDSYFSMFINVIYIFYVTILIVHSKLILLIFKIHYITVEYIDNLTLQKIGKYKTFHKIVDVLSLILRNIVSSS